MHTFSRHNVDAPYLVSHEGEGYTLIVCMNDGDAVIAKDEKQQWDAMRKVGKTKFVAGFFVRTFVVSLAGIVSVSAAHLARTKQWSGRDLALGILFAFIFSALAVGRTWSVSSASPTAILDRCF
jgi:hypothetical protein